ncbi:putative ABC transporter-binding protein [Paenibacillus sp. CECT 9249]|uniref:ABC transporter substrate-binding protein n=1 Tax=Paenibacillus sp. CECT 9249 TaxID=2845385 RepID=UPI001E39FDF2|nr:ABC transporter substrate-binding protein [Paenibacillus sp. CECT 9249]CAH0121195.1 putative ABC transporter-binding protein [Paenibacillus sp. CECT 9249]
MKKTFIAVLALILMIATAACGGNKETGAKKGKVTLALLSHYAGSNEEKLKPYIDEWNKANPDIQVKLTPVEFEQLLPTIMSKQTAGQVADIVHVYALWGGQLIKNKVLADAPDDVVTDVKANYPDAAVRGASLNGKVFGYPTEVQTYGLFYNKKLLKEAGFDNPPATWDELLAMAEKINRKDGSGKTLVQGFGFQRSYAGIVDQPFMALMATAGGTLLSEDLTTAQANSDAAKKTLELYSKIYGNNGISDIGINPTKAFGTEQVAMTVGAGWWAGSLKTLMKENFANVGAAPLPSPDGTAQGSLAYTWAWGVNSKSKHQEEAWKFLKWFNTEAFKDGMTAEGSFLLDAFNSISTRKSDLESAPIQEKLKTDPIMKVFTDALDYAVHEQNPPTGSEIQNILYREIENMWAGKTTPEEAAENANRDIQAKLGE